MNVVKLMELGQRAESLRRLMESGVDVPDGKSEYRQLIEEIDEETDKLKAKHPDKFWKERDPVYMAMKKQWGVDRMFMGMGRHE